MKKGKLFNLIKALTGVSFLLSAFTLVAQKPIIKTKSPIKTIKSAISPDELFLKQGTFIIRNADDYRYLTVKDITPRDQSIVYIWQFVERVNQQQGWTFIPVSNGYYKIRSSSGYFLSQKRLLAPTVETAMNDDSQLWLLKFTNDGYYNIISKTNRYLGVTDSRERDGGLVGFSGTTNNYKFKWHLIKWTQDERKTTPFNPSTMGFRFENRFRGVDGSYRYSGLCGGMVYSSLDYYNAKKAIPTQTYKPANRTPLQSYIFGRQNNSSIESNLDKWIELRADALGVRDSEFFEWGLRAYSGGRLEELRNVINTNKPVPLGLYAGRSKGLDGYESGDHQVLAIGYALGRYTGNMQGHKGDMKIFIYNPNNPNKTMTLVPDLKNKCFLEVESGICWRTYFVDSKYSPHSPPNISDLAANEPDGSIRHIYATFVTGSDDLRGGNDNVHLTINYKDGSSQTFNNVNGKARWVDNNDETVPLTLNRAVRKTDIQSFKITTTFGGGIGGDNWNLNKFYVTNGGDFTIVCANCKEGDRMPMVRFTGDKKEHTVLIN